MVDRNVFDRRLAKLERLLADLRQVATTDREFFLADRKTRALAERWLHLAIECAIDLAHHLIADAGWESPATYRETFRILAQHEVLEPELAKNMEAWAGMRNVLVHLYLDIDHETLYTTLTTELDQLEDYGTAIAQAAADAGFR